MTSEHDYQRSNTDVSLPDFSRGEREGGGGGGVGAVHRLVGAVDFRFTDLQGHFCNKVVIKTKLL